VGITAARRAVEQASLCESLGLDPVVGPCIDVDRPVDDEAMLAPLRAALDDALTVTVFMTGIGSRHVMGVAERHGLADRLAARLAETTVVARGSKARNALRRQGIRVDHVADPPETSGVLAILRRLVAAGDRVLVQSAGPTPDDVGAAVTDLGATPFDVRPYAIAAPSDDLPAIAMIRAAERGELAAVTFTSAHAVEGFAALAERADADPDRIAEAGVMMASVGPVTSAALTDLGMRVGYEPEVSRMGALYQGLARRLGARTG